jgi:MFS family permease
LATKKNKPYYGWAITSMGTLGNALQGGFIFWSMGMYTSAFEDHFNAPRAKITLIETFLMVTTNLLSPLAGMWVDKKSARHLVAVGALALGSGLILISLAGQLVQIWLVYILLIPLAALALGVLPSSALISRWFRRRRGLALGISVSGSSIGGALAPPFLTFMFMAYGWRTALQVSGAFIILLAPVFFRVLANYPEDRGLLREKPTAENEAFRTADEVDWRIRDIMRTRTFWMQTLISGCLLAVTLGMLANLSLHAKDLGFAGQQTALLYSMIALCSFAGKIVSGSLIDRIGLRLTGGLTVVLMATGMLLFLLFDSYSALLTASVVVGLATGGVSPVWTTMIAQGFGAKSFGRTFGVMNPMHIPITGPSAPLAGFISDTTGSYDLVFLIYIGLCTVAGICLYFLRMPAVRRNAQPRENREPPSALD